MTLALQELLAMVPQPVLAVLMCYPITDDTEAAAEAGVCVLPSARSSRALNLNLYYYGALDS